MEESRENPIGSMFELEKYVREYQLMALWLLENDMIEEKTYDKKFWVGLPQDVRDKIKNLRQAEEGAAYSNRVTPSFKTTHGFARRIFDHRAFDAEVRFRHSAERAIKLEKKQKEVAKASKRKVLREARGLPDVNWDKENVIEKRGKKRARSDDDPEEVRGIIEEMRSLKPTESGYATRYRKVMDVAPSLLQTMATPRLEPRGTRRSKPAGGEERANVSVETQQEAVEDAREGDEEAEGVSQSFSGVKSDQIWPRTGGPLPQQPFRARPGRSNLICWFCAKEGHIPNSCKSAWDYINKGLLKFENNRVLLPNGESLQKDEDGTQRTWLDRYLKEAEEAQSSHIEVCFPEEEERKNEEQGEEEEREEGDVLVNEIYEPIEPDTPPQTSREGSPEAEPETEVEEIEQEPGEEEGEAPEETTGEVSLCHLLKEEVPNEETEMADLIYHGTRFRMTEAEVPMWSAAFLCGYDARGREDWESPWRQNGARLERGRRRGKQREDCQHSRDSGNQERELGSGPKGENDRPGREALPRASSSVLKTSTLGTDQILYACGLDRMGATINGKKCQLMLDSGSEINVMSEKQQQWLGLTLNPEAKMTMVTANNSKEQMIGVCEGVEIEAGNLKLKAHIHVTRRPGRYSILMGQPWIDHVRGVFYWKGNQKHFRWTTDEGVREVRLTLERDPKRRDYLPAREFGRGEVEPGENERGEGPSLQDRAAQVSFLLAEEAESWEADGDEPRPPEYGYERTETEKLDPYRALDRVLVALSEEGKLRLAVYPTAPIGVWIGQEEVAAGLEDQFNSNLNMIDSATYLKLLRVSGGPPKGREDMLDTSVLRGIRVEVRANSVGSTRHMYFYTSDRVQQPVVLGHAFWFLAANWDLHIQFLELLKLDPVDYAPEQAGQIRTWNPGRPPTPTATFNPAEHPTGEDEGGVSLESSLESEEDQATVGGCWEIDGTYREDSPVPWTEDPNEDRTIWTEGSEEEEGLANSLYEPMEVSSEDGRTPEPTWGVAKGEQTYVGGYQGPPYAQEGPGRGPSSSQSRTEEKPLSSGMTLWARTSEWGRMDGPSTTPAASPPVPEGERRLALLDPPSQDWWYEVREQRRNKGWSELTSVFGTPSEAGASWADSVEEELTFGTNPDTEDESVCGSYLGSESSDDTLGRIERATKDMIIDRLGREGAERSREEVSRDLLNLELINTRTYLDLRDPETFLQEAEQSKVEMEEWWRIRERMEQAVRGSSLDKEEGDASVGCFCEAENDGFTAHVELPTPTEVRSEGDRFPRWGDGGKRWGGLPLRGGRGRARPAQGGRRDNQTKLPPQGRGQPPQENWGRPKQGKAFEAPREQEVKQMLAPILSHTFESPAHRNCSFCQENPKDRPEKGGRSEAIEFKADTSTMYKTVDKKVKPVDAALPSGMQPRMVVPADLMADLPVVPTHPGPVRYGTRLTQPRLEKIMTTVDPSCSEEERRLIAHVLLENERLLAWTDEEKGHFDENLVPPYVNPMVPHQPWQDRPIRIPISAIPKVIKLLREKLASGVYERSQAAYRSRFFLVNKKESDQFRIVHDLQKYNSLTIQDAGLPPSIETFVEGFGGRSCLAILDLMDGYGQKALAEESRDATTFASPIGALRLKTLPQGATNSVAEFQRTVSFILEEELPDPADIFVDDVGVKGPKTKYEDPVTGEPQTLAGNPGIRRYVYEHLVNLNRILYRMRRYGGTFKGGKCQPLSAEATLCGYRCSYAGTRISESALQKIETWPQPQDRTDVRGFLGTVSQSRNWISGFGLLTAPLRRLTRQDVDFDWGDAEEDAMNEIKKRIKDSSFLVTLDYSSPNPIVLAVDTSARAVGYSLAQDDATGKRRIARYGSLLLNERESRYSQAKLELYGLFRALRKNHVYLYGRKFVVELDAAYVKGMLSSPEQPNAAMTRWVYAILLYTFDIVHVPAAKHVAVDGLSRRKRAEEDESEEEDAEEWLDDFVGWTEADEDAERKHGGGEDEASKEEDLREELYPGEEGEEWVALGRYLIDFKLPEGLTTDEGSKFHRKAKGYLVAGGRIWKKGEGMPREVVVDATRRERILQENHENLGHKGQQATARRIADRYYWKGMYAQIAKHVRTCNDCQHRDLKRYESPIHPTFPATIFSKVSVDLVSMPPQGGFTCIVLARDDLSGWVEAQALKDKGAKTVAAFLWEMIISRGVVPGQVTTDQGGEFKGEFAEALRRYNIPQIRCSTYHPQANGMLERGNRPFKEAILRSCRGAIQKWPSLVPYAAWADRITTKRTTGFSPYRLLFGVDPVLPLDFENATWLVRGWDMARTTTDLLELRMRQLIRRSEDEELAKKRVEVARTRSADDHNDANRHRQLQEPIKPGQLVLVRNSSLDFQHSRKSEDLYNGPVRVRGQTKSGAYLLEEIDGTAIKTTYAHTRIRPYHTREGVDVDKLGEAHVELDTDDEELPIRETGPSPIPGQEEEEEEESQGRITRSQTRDNREVAEREKREKKEKRGVRTRWSSRLRLGEECEEGDSNNSN